MAVHAATPASKPVAPMMDEPSAPSVNKSIWRPYIPQRPRSGSIARYNVCHLCDQSFESAHDLKRHLSSKKHIPSGVQHEYSELEEESEDDADELDEFQAQLLAAANREHPGDAVGDRDDAPFQSPRPITTEPAPHAADLIQEAPSIQDQSRGHQFHGAAVEHASQTRQPTEASPLPATALIRQTTSRQPPAGHQSVPASALTPLRGATRMLIGARENARSQTRPHPPQNAPSNPQGVRRCYGCGCAFPSKEILWNHAPCFTTTVQPVACSQNSHGVTRNDAIQRSLTPDKHDSGQEMVVTKFKPPAMQLSDPATPESFVDVAPSLRVQQLLIAIAQCNPEARPIPPWELARLTDESPDLFETVTRMEQENAELQRSMRQQRPVSPPLHQDPMSGDMELASQSLPRNGDGMAARPMDGSKTNTTVAEPNIEKVRSIEVSQSQGHRWAQPSFEAHGGHEGIRSSPSGSRGNPGQLLARATGTPQNGLHFATSNDGSIRLQRWQGGNSANVGGHHVLQVRHSAVGQNASLSTVSGLMLVDATSSDYERIIEDDTP
ncbi:hypothetical protein CERZMDRAFT_81112 [Cercospora zeae-maydis SCOH1-5]|uniref:C2H2-type domain-containing protein n=1 Tax=Cercospora zeae-maydis SCOH1-5 TaxID=717836 RepID=A0A6A6FUH2_9PEZI|nr:hypothetical protein CERZMDRAFT_81112 [Cercospora zeae-maydis SCOH1-5]